MTVQFTRAQTPGDTYLTTWALVTADATGAAEELPGAADRTVQISATEWGGATIVLEGSIDGTKFMTLTNPAGDPIEHVSGADTDEATNAPMFTVAENPRYIRARLSTAGTAAVISVLLLSRSLM